MAGFDIYGQVLTPSIHQTREMLDRGNFAPATRRAIEKHLRQQERSYGARLDERVKAADAEVVQREDDIEDSVLAAHERAEHIEANLKAGRIGVKEVRKALAEVGRDLRTARARADQLRHDAQAVADLAAMDVGDYQADLLERFPTLKQSLAPLVLGEDA